MEQIVWRASEPCLLGLHKAAGCPDVRSLRSATSMTALLVASAALAELVYIALLGSLCLLTNLTGSRLPGWLTRRVLPLSKGARRGKARQRLLVARLARD